MLMTTPRKITLPDGIGAGLVAGGGALMGVGAVLAAGQQDVWSNPWFDGGCAALAAGGVLLIVAFVSWWRSRRLETPNPKIAVKEQQAAEQDSPLRLLPQRGVWRPFAGTAWGFGIPVRVINITEESITLVRYRLLNGSEAPQRSSLAYDLQAEIDTWLANLLAEHNSELFAGEIVVPPCASITRWFIGWAPAPLPNDGRPALTMQFEDVFTDTYNVNIPGRPRRSF
jgi:hypothetical protein